MFYMLLSIFIVHKLFYDSTDGSTVGIVLDSASDEEVSRLDALLGQLANLKMVDVTATVEREREKEERGVVSAEDTAPPTWGSTVAGVRKLETIQIYGYVYTCIPNFGEY